MARFQADPIRRVTGSVYPVLDADCIIGTGVYRHSAVPLDDGRVLVTWTENENSENEAVYLCRGYAPDARTYGTTNASVDTDNAQVLADSTPWRASTNRNRIYHRLAKVGSYLFMWAWCNGGSITGYSGRFPTYSGPLEVRLYRSTDDGLTWSLYAFGTSTKSYNGSNFGGGSNSLGEIIEVEQGAGLGTIWVSVIPHLGSYFGAVRIGWVGIWSNDLGLTWYEAGASASSFWGADSLDGGQGSLTFGQLDPVGQPDVLTHYGTRRGMGHDDGTLPGRDWVEIGQDSPTNRNDDFADFSIENEFGVCSQRYLLNRDGRLWEFSPVKTERASAGTQVADLWSDGDFEIYAVDMGDGIYAFQRGDRVNCLPVPGWRVGIIAF